MCSASTAAAGEGWPVIGVVPRTHDSPTSHPSTEQKLPQFVFDRYAMVPTIDNDEKVIISRNTPVPGFVYRQFTACMTTFEVGRIG